MKSNVFDITPSAGVLSPKQSMNIKIQFNPSKPQKYDILLPFITDDNIKFKDLRLKAEGASPCLLFETDDLILPTVPTNVVSKSRFIIINDGFNKTFLNYSIEKNIPGVTLNVDFVNENHLNNFKNNIIVEISFVAKFPVSFLTRIEFEDSLKKNYQVTVSGTSDDSLLTNFFPGANKGLSMKKTERNKLEMFNLGLQISNYLYS